MSDRLDGQVSWSLVSRAEDQGHNSEHVDYKIVLLLLLQTFINKSMLPNFVNLIRKDHES